MHSTGRPVCALLLCVLLTHASLSLTQQPAPAQTATKVFLKSISGHKHENRIPEMTRDIRNACPNLQIVEDIHQAEYRIILLRLSTWGITDTQVQLMDINGNILDQSRTNTVSGAMRRACTMIKELKP